MICPFFEYDENLLTKLKQRLNSRSISGSQITEQVTKILENVEQNGDDALLEYTRKFDCPNFDLKMLVTSQEEIEEAFLNAPVEDIDIIKEAASNIRKFHNQQLEKSWINTQDDGTILGQLVRPVDRAGLYIPGGQGGQTPLISSLLMNAIPGQVAGVSQLALVSPPRKDGSLNPYLLMTAHILGIKEIYKIGSAWAVGALAFGTKTIKAVDIITGPGNIFVASAKQQVMGRVGIDMIAGPSEIVILADKTANPKWLAADMLSQAEHDVLASSIVIATCKKMLEDINDELDKQLKVLPRKEIARNSLADWGALIYVNDIEDGITLVNNLAPEHLELCVHNPWEMLGKIKHAGAIFMGHHTPEAIGDYFAGPNHVLPTLSTARFSSALSVQTFCKKTSIIYASASFTNCNASKIARMARIENLEAHALSVEARIK